MTKEQLTVDVQSFQEIDTGYEDLKIAVEKITKASEQEFEQIKKEKWYTRLFDLVTFSNKKDIRLATQISSLAQAQNVLMSLLVKLSETDEKASQIIAELMSDIRRLQNNDDYLFSRITELENRCVLGIRKSLDVSSLSDVGKKVLSGCLYKMAEAYEKPTEAQQDYANAVLNYIHEDAHVAHLDNALEELNESERRKIYTCCREYMFLNKNVVEIPDALKSVMDDFDLGNKTVRTIAQQIANSYALRGSVGFITKYQQPCFSESDDIYFEVEDESLPATENIDKDADDEDDGYSVGIKKEAWTTEKEKIYLTTIQQVSKGTEKAFAHKNIYIETFIECAGKLKFDDCVIHFHMDGKASQIILEEKGKLYLTNCELECEGLNTTPFIEAKEGSTVLIEYCNLYNCTYFLKAEEVNGVGIFHSKILNPCNAVVWGSLARDGHFLLDKCSIVEDTLPIWQERNNFENCYHCNMFEVKHEKTEKLDDPIALITDCKVMRTENFQKKYGIGRIPGFVYFPREFCSEIRNCTFIGLSNVISTRWNVNHCRFENCERAISNPDAIQGEEGYYVTDCCFIKCTSVLAATGGVGVKKCQFIDCGNNIISMDVNTSISYCEFVDIWNDTQASIEWDSTWVRGKKPETIISNCVFSGAKLKEPLFSAYTAELKHAPVAAFENCCFTGCELTQDSKLSFTQQSAGAGVFVQVTSHYDVLFVQDIPFEVATLSNCIGISSKGILQDNAGSVTKPTIKTRDDEGELIGAHELIES